jgi:hypothetical protein
MPIRETRTPLEKAVANFKVARIGLDIATMIPMFPAKE